jgi:hypothetical protein
MFDMPVGSFRFEKLAEPQVEELKSIGLQHDLSSKNIFVGSPNFAQIPRINAIGTVGDRIRPGHVQFEGYLAYSFLIKGAHIFTSLKESMKSGQYFHGFSKNIDPSISPEQAVPLRRIDDEEETEVTNTSPFFMRPSEDILCFNGNGAVSEFEGCFIDASKDFKTSREGVFFPFFNGMLVPDKEIAFRVFSSIFYGTLATTEDLNISILNRVRVGVRQLAFSRAGLALSHLYFIFGLSLQIPGSYVRIVLKGNSYVGAVIDGTFSVRLFGNTVASGVYTKDITDVNLLLEQAKELVGILNGLENENGSRPYNFSVSDFETSRKTLRSWSMVDTSLFASSELKERSISIIEAMEFNDNFPVCNQKTFGHFLSFMSTGNEEITSEYPAYLQGKTLRHSGRTYEGLTMFGPKGPSISTGDKKSLTFDLPGSGKKDTNLDLNSEGKRNLQYLAVWLVPIHVAAIQWNLVIGSGKLCLPHPRKGKKEFVSLNGVLFQLSAKDEFQEAYLQIKSLVNVSKKSVSGKRKAKGDPVDKVGSKKKKGSDEADEI